MLENPTIRQEHVSAYEYILQNQERITANILDTLLLEYPRLQEQYDYDEVEKLEIMPDVNNVESFASLIELSNVYILNVAKKGIAYVGFSFWTTWDDEHGLGVMTHQDKVIEIGGADTAFLTWIAERDLNPAKVNYRISEENFNQNMQKTKLWWKFW